MAMSVHEDMRDSELNTCCICLDRHIETVLTCFHAYCKPCIEDWKTRDPTCPMCRDEGNGRGSFELMRIKSGSQHDQMKIQLMRELAQIIGELLGRTVGSDEISEATSSS